MASKRSYHHGDLKNALVAAAARLIEKRRHADFTVRELAEEAGVSHAAAYRHFSGKNDILAEVAGVGFAKLQAAFVAAARAHPDDIVAELAAKGEAYVRFAAAHTGYFRAMFHVDLGGPAEYPGLESIASQAFESLLSVVTRGVAAGAFVKREPMELAIAAWSVVHGLATLLVDGRMDQGGPPPNSAALSGMVIELLLAGLRAKGARGKKAKRPRLRS
jgi:AcrR family transcriptional regulator